MELIPPEFDLARLSTDELAARLAGEQPVVVLLSVGAVEPHGPHLSLYTDIVISQSAAARAARRLTEHGIVALIAPPIPYGVTNCAAAFKGAVSVASEVFTAYLSEVIASFLNDGAAQVCVVNNHLEPAHDAAVRAAAGAFEDARVSVACPLTRRWARTLSDEFKSGACHAGEYETSIVMASAPDLVDETARSALPDVPISLSDKLHAGIDDFKAMGLTQAYAGAPARATAQHGEQQLAMLADMIVTEISEALERLRSH